MSEETLRLIVPNVANDRMAPAPPSNDPTMNDLSWHTEMYLRGQAPPPESVPKNESPPVDPASFMGAMKDSLPAGADVSALMKHVSLSLEPMKGNEKCNASNSNKRKADNSQMVSVRMAFV